MLVMDSEHPVIVRGIRAGGGAAHSQRLEIHYTPKHGSWLNMAEIELGVLARQCLDRRIPSQEVLEQETGAWEEQRNREATVAWRFIQTMPASSSSPFTHQQ